MRKPLSVLMLALAAAPSWAVTIDFSEFPATETTEISPGAPLITQGFAIDRDDNTVLFIGAAASPPDAPALAWSPNDTTLSIEEAGGAVFSLSSFDLWNILADADMTVTGFVSTGGIVQETLATPFEWQTFSFGTEWSHLTRVEISSTPGGLGQIIDNIEVSVVPLPPAALLFASALTLLGLRRRMRAGA